MNEYEPKKVIDQATGEEFMIDEEPEEMDQAAVEELNEVATIDNEVVNETSRK